MGGLFLLDKVVKLVSGGSVINGAYLPRLVFKFVKLISEIYYLVSMTIVIDWHMFGLDV